MNVNDLRIILGTDGIYRHKFIINVKQNKIIVLFSIPKSNTSRQIVFSTINDVCSLLNIRQCVLNKAVEKSKNLNCSIWLYSLDQID